MEALTDQQLEEKLSLEAETKQHQEDVAWAGQQRARDDRDRAFRLANSRRQSKSHHRAVCIAAWFSIHGRAASTNRGGR